MNPDPTISISLEYLVELSDDGQQPDQPEPEVLILPPESNGASPLAKPASAPDQGS